MQLLGPERLVLVLVLLVAALATLRGAEALAEVPALAAADTHELVEAVLDVTLAVVRLVRDACDEVVHAGGAVDIRGADLAELVQDAVAELLPVLPKLLLDLLLGHLCG